MLLSRFLSLVRATDDGDFPRFLPANAETMVSTGKVSLSNAPLFPSRPPMPVMGALHPGYEIRCRKLSLVFEGVRDRRVVCPWRPFNPNGSL